jgi:hypothetical protein
VCDVLVFILRLLGRLPEIGSSSGSEICMLRHCTSSLVGMHIARRVF